MQDSSPASVHTASREILVETADGKLRGAADNGVYVFKGVRYAETTAGANRFLPPQPTKKWSGVRDALHWGFSAPQYQVPEHTDPFYAWYGAIQPISEDCLFLNVFTPGLDGAKRPVMFWIHGGSFREFSGTAPGLRRNEFGARTRRRRHHDQSPPLGIRISAARRVGCTLRRLG